MEIRFDVAGMTCAACSARVEKVTGQVPGVEKAEVNLLAGSMVVKAENTECIQEIISAVHKAGYDASVHGEKRKEEKHNISFDDSLKEMKRRIIGSAVSLIVLMYFTMGHMIGLPLPSWYHGAENAVVAALLQFFFKRIPVYLN